MAKQKICKAENCGKLIHWVWNSRLGDGDWFEESGDRHLCPTWIDPRADIIGSGITHTHDAKPNDIQKMHEDIISRFISTQEAITGLRRELIDLRHAVRNS